MARPRKKATFVPPSGVRDIKIKFLTYALRHRSKALRLLATDVREGKISPKQWAESLGQGGTWIEVWAEDTIRGWRTGAQPVPRIRETGELEPLSLYPRTEGPDNETFTCTLTDTMLSRLSHRVSVGGGPWWESDSEDDRDIFRKAMHAKLDSELDRFFAIAVRSGASKEIKLPSDLELKLEAAALYLLCGVDRQALSNEIHKAAQTVYEWLIDVVRLLGLKMKRRGHPTSSSKPRTFLLVFPN
jgi:hypothetical protein